MSPKRLYHWTIRVLKEVRNHMVPVVLFTCNERKDDEPLSVLFAGWDRKLSNYWFGRFSGDCEYRTRKKLILRSSLSKYLLKTRGTCDILIIEPHHILQSADQFDYCFQLPRWMEMVIELEPSLHRTRTKEIRRRIRKYSLEYEFRREKKDFDLFHSMMYKPLIEQRHKGSADTAAYRLFLHKFLNEGADLLFAVRNGEPVAAQLIEKREGLCRILAFGIRNASVEIQKMGVHAALYYFAMNHYALAGHHTLLCGSSMPVVLDGVTQFKIRIGAKPYLKDLPKRQRYYLIPMSSSPSLKNAMKANPLFHMSGAGLDMALFIEPKDYAKKEDFMKMFRRISCENVGRINLYCFSDPRKISQWAKEEEMTHIKCIRYEGESD